MLSANCTGPFWQTDHINPCHLHNYLQFVPLSACLAVSFLFTAASLLRKNSKPQAIEGIEKPADRSNPAAWIVIRGKSISDKLRLATEVAAGVAELVFLILNVRSWSTNAATMAVALSALSLVFAVYRLAPRTVGHPFEQCAYIYTVQFTVYAVSWLSNDGMGWETLAAAVKTSVLYTSPMGDRPARLYCVPDSLPSLEPVSSLLRSLTCCWNMGLINAAYKSGRLDLDDVWELEEKMHSYELFKQYSSSHSKSLIWRLIGCFSGPLIANVFFGCVGQLLGLMPIFFVNWILQYAEDTTSVPKSTAWLYVVGIGVSLALHQIVINQAFYHGRRLSVIYRSIFIAEIYKKALMSQVSPVKDVKEAADNEDDASQDEDEEFTANSGAIINLMSVDTFKIAGFISYLHDVIASPILVIAGVLYLHVLMGASAFAGIFVMVLSVPLNYKVAKMLGTLQERVMAVTDKRVDKTNEALNAVRVIKYFAWERKFMDSINELRDKEMALLWYRYCWVAFGGIVYYSMPLLITASSFICYVKVEHKQLTSSVAFTSMAVFNVMRFPLGDLANNVSSFMASKVSYQRIAKYLLTEDTPKYSHKTGSGLGFEGATFSWDDTFYLRDLNLKFIEKDLNVIIGPTGSGKTSLLMALLGEMNLIEGKLCLPNAIDRRSAPIGPDGFTETIAYCPQQAWMVNDTVRSNILFASEYDPKRYQNVLKACQLSADLKIWAKGDATVIGDKGISLSGGQKQRVSLARALYSNSRHLVLDDCLSAVDSHTADAIYEHALVGPLAKGRTVVLVSHNVALTVSRAAQVVVMRNGRIEAAGTPSEVSNAGALGTDELIQQRARDSELSRTSSKVDVTAVPAAAAAAAATEESPEQDQEEEENEERRGLGSIPFSTYVAYARSLGGRVWWFTAIALLLLYPFGQYLENWWLKRWTSSYETVLGALYVKLLDALTVYTNNRDTSKGILYYSGIYILTGVAHALISTASEIVCFSGSVNGSKKIFRQMLYSVLHAKLEFFDTTPIGRIVNRFSKDIEGIDQELMFELHHFFQCILDATTVTVVISITTPGFVPAAIIICIAYTYVGQYYLIVSRELKRLESTSRSPIFQQFGETLAGSVCIRAYGDATRFETNNMNLVDDSHRPYFNLWLANRWLAFWSSMLSMLVVFFAAFFVVLNAESLGAGLAGVSLSYSMMFGDAILWIVRMYAQVEIQMNSVERLYEYIDIEQEAAAIVPECRPPSSWPQTGAIEFKDLSLRYKESLPLVIKDVSFKVQGGEKVGVVGRTGAGKSTILSAIFRILEPVTGSVEIDGLDIATIGLRDLRKSLAIIPQDPTLFTGTLRTNLDLFNEYSDDEIFSALRKVHLVDSGAATPVSESSENANPFQDLSRAVTENGNNLSQGQRQLLCLARAVLRQPRILVMDEATASIDYETDALIQVAIREAFKDVTVLTIAHRLRTIGDYDKVLVLDQGNVAQFGSPHQLLKQREGLYFDMCEKSGELEALLNLAGL